MRRYESKYAVCPFYKSEDDLKIYCEGVEDGTFIHLSFSTSTKLKKRYRCKFCEGQYSDCRIAKMLLAKYDE